MIKEAFYIKDYLLDIVFADGLAKRIDLRGFLSGSDHPLIRKYLDTGLFAGFYIDHGTICWGDNDLEISPQKIRQGVYDAV